MFINSYFFFFFFFNDTATTEIYTLSLHDALPIFVLAALTKGDTLARAVRARREGDLRSALELEEDQMIVTSAREKEGIDDLREAIAGLIRRPPRDPGLAPGVSLPPGPG